MKDYAIAASIALVVVRALEFIFAIVSIALAIAGGIVFLCISALVEGLVLEMTSWSHTFDQAMLRFYERHFLPALAYPAEYLDRIGDDLEETLPV